MSASFAMWLAFLIGHSIQYSHGRSILPETCVDIQAAMAIHPFQSGMNSSRSYNSLYSACLTASKYIFLGAWQNVRDTLPARDTRK